MTITIAQAQRNNARLYREWARHSPWNSKTRAGWLQLAETAERVAANDDAERGQKSRPNPISQPDRG